jgi:hypothetical protein
MTVNQTMTGALPAACAACYKEAKAHGTDAIEQGTKMERVPTLAIAVTSKNLTVAAIARQLLAMKIGAFLVGVLKPDGKMINLHYTWADLYHAISWLRHENAKGAHIYIKPAGERHPLVLVDDLSHEAIGQMQQDGWEPCLVTETSPRNYQAWIHLGTPVEVAIRKAVARKLAATYHGDPNSADGDHYGRLAGFTNRKEKYRRPNGMYPFVKVLMTQEKSATQAETLIEALSSSNPTLPNKEANRENRHVETRMTHTGEAAKAIREYHRQAKVIKALYPNTDYSRLDWMIVTEMLEQGFSADAVEVAMREASPLLEERKKGHIDDYITRTVTKAMHAIANGGSIDSDLPMKK